MFTLKRHSIDVLEGHATARFIERMMGHFRIFYPETSERLGEESLRSFIQRGTQKAKSYGVHLEPGVCKFLTLMLELGESFDTDATLPWVQALLVKGQPAPIELLVEATHAYLKVQEA